MISFIIIGRNEGRRLVNSIESVHRFANEEKLTDYEIVYVDSRSSDNSIANAIAAGVDKVFLIKGECNAAIGRNIGAKESKGNILFFLDGDMELIPGFLATITDRNGKMKYPFVSGIENDVLHDNEWNYVKTQHRRQIIHQKDSYEMTTGGLFCIDKDLWNEVGGMDSRLKRNQDLDLGVRLYLKGHPLCRKNDLWVNHYTRFYGVRAESESGVRYSALFVRKHLFKPAVQTKLASSTYSYWLLMGCLLAAFVIPFWIPLLVYMSSVVYRSVRTIQRTDVKLNPVKVFMARLKKDLKFWWFFMSYWPETPQLEYEQVYSEI